MENYSIWLDNFIKDNNINVGNIIADNITVGQFLEYTKQIDGWHDVLMAALIKAQEKGKTDVYISKLCKKAIKAGYQIK